MKVMTTITDIALHQISGNRRCLPPQIFFGDDQAVQLELWNAFSWRVANIRLQQSENAPFVQAARFLLLGYHLKHQQATAENRHCWRTRPQS
jgi:hypothetical protein